MRHLPRLTRLSGIHFLLRKNVGTSFHHRFKKCAGSPAEQSIPYFISCPAQQRVYVGDIPADFYLSNSPDIANTIVWTLQDGETAFYLSGFFSKEELIEMAEHVLSYDGEKIKNYAPKWLPEGYEETKQTTLPTLKNVVYTNADGQAISFSCTYGDNGGDTVFIDDYRSVFTVMVGNVQADFYQASQG